MEEYFLMNIFFISVIIGVQCNNFMLHNILSIFKTIVIPTTNYDVSYYRFLIL